MKHPFQNAVVLSFAAISLGLVGCGEKEAAVQAAPGNDDMTPVAQDAAPAAPAPNEPIVTVEGETLTTDMADQIARQMARREGVPPQMIDAFMQQAGDQLQEQATQQFIDEVLVRKALANSDIEVSEEDVDAGMEKLSQQLPDEMTIDQFAQARGTTVESIRNEVTMNERFQKLYDEKTAAVEDVTDEDIAEFYTANPERFARKENVTARHILLKVEEDASEEARAEAKKEAEAIRKKLAEGADFAELAKAESDCPSKQRGGDLGTFGRGQMVPEFEQIAFSQDIGEISPVVETQFGYHVIEVTGREAAGTQTLDEVSGTIHDRLSAQARNEVFTDYVRGLREDADIEFAEDAE